ncbi:hypothetical protein SISNIDRAFT_490342 [Sistotremastrum niveocremeum HHB9708]|uniref:RING-type domain-containing protein n=1 Tax=Sistotremastrum niveocremeum HHB9708 TaxID=1314777 RepID=A0A164NY36_9AGAM|nr:hypothetical protein SISNIDRAFT_490342 [Sistotremastrum niveocremeum HHB9708]
MSQSSPSKGKKRALSQDLSEQDTSHSRIPSPTTETPAKKSKKKADTRPCPVCDEPIPIRLLAAHLEFEMNKVQEVIDAVGSTSVLPAALELIGDSSFSRTRKARKSHVQQPHIDTGGIATDPELDPSIDQASKTIRTIIRNRRQRYTKLRDFTRDLLDDRKKIGASRGMVNGGDISICPVCEMEVPGDRDVVEAHVDACILGSVEAERQRMDDEGLEQYETAGETRVRVIGMTGTRGMGFDVRDSTQVDVDDELDIDGDEEDMYGEAQFTERDVITLNGNHAQEDVVIDDDEDGESAENALRMLVAAGKGPSQRPSLAVSGSELDILDSAIIRARAVGDKDALVAALDRKISHLETSQTPSPGVNTPVTSENAGTTSLCRICIEVYTEPTVSTGCWHTCCRECWLRCLGTTKLCPICKRITSANELRRIYL